MDMMKVAQLLLPPTPQQIFPLPTATQQGNTALPGPPLHHPPPSSNKQQGVAYSATSALPGPPRHHSPPLNTHSGRDRNAGINPKEHKDCIASDQADHKPSRLMHGQGRPLTDRKGNPRSASPASRERAGPHRASLKGNSRDSHCRRSRSRSRERRGRTRSRSRERSGRTRSRSCERRERTRSRSREKGGRARSRSRDREQHPIHPLPSSSRSGGPGQTALQSSRVRRSKSPAAVDRRNSDPRAVVRQHHSDRERMSQSSHHQQPADSLRKRAAESPAPPPRRAKRTDTNFDSDPAIPGPPRISSATSGAVAVAAAAPHMAVAAATATAGSATFCAQDPETDASVPAALPTGQLPETQRRFRTAPLRTFEAAPVVLPTPTAHMTSTPELAGATTRRAEAATAATKSRDNSIDTMNKATPALSFTIKTTGTGVPCLKKGMLAGRIMTSGNPSPEPRTLNPQKYTIRCFFNTCFLIYGLTFD